MEFIVNGTKKELNAVDANGTEWTRDLLGNHDALNYDNEQEEYVLSEEDYNWWNAVIEQYNEVLELEDKLDDEMKEIYDLQYWSCDLDVEIKERLNWLKERL